MESSTEMTDKAKPLVAENSYNNRAALASNLANYAQSFIPHHISHRIRNRIQGFACLAIYVANTQSVSSELGSMIVSLCLQINPLPLDTKSRIISLLSRTGHLIIASCKQQLEVPTNTSQHHVPQFHSYPYHHDIGITGSAHRYNLFQVNNGSSSEEFALQPSSG